MLEGELPVRSLPVSLQPAEPCNELANIAVYVFECEVAQAETLLEMARDHCPPAVKDTEHAILPLRRANAGK